MKLTKKILNEHGIYNSWEIFKKLDNTIFVNFVPANNGRLTARYAYWVYTRLDQGQIKTRDFTVTCRENKLIVLETVFNFIRGSFGLDIGDKDPFGAYHPKGTLEKLEKLIKADKE